tara:strand:+ start:94416 stop:95249 length:834 start_codon:yes stop_codon:yes gene_type:complete
MPKRFYAFVILALLLNVSTSLAYEKKVFLASLDWEPYVGPNLKNNGYVAELVEQAFMAVGYLKKDIIIEFVPWARAVVYGRTGYYDGIVPEYFMPQRAKHYRFSVPFPGGPVGFYKRKSFDLKYKDFDDLAKQFTERNWKIGVVNEYVNTVDFDENPNIAKIKEYAVSDTMNIKKLIAGRFPLIFIDKNIAHSIIEKLPHSDQIHQTFEMSYPPLERKDFYICFSKKSPFHEEKMADFNEGYKILEESGVIKRIMKKHDLTYYKTHYEKDVNARFNE